MIKIDLVWIFLLASLLASFLVLLVFNIVNFSRKESNDSFLRTFPYEALTSENKTSKIYKIFLFIYSGLCFAPLFDIVPNIDKFGNLGALPIIISCVFGFMGLCASAIHIFEAKFIKTHTIVSTMSMAFTFLGSGLTCLFSILVYNANAALNEAKIVSIVIAALSGIIAIAVLGLGINPKLKDWTKLEKVTSPDGTVTYKRPNVFILPLTEWIILALGLLSEVLFFASLIK